MSGPSANGCKNECIVRKNIENNEWLMPPNLYLCRFLKPFVHYTLVQYGTGGKKIESDNGGQECDTKTNYKVFLPVLWIRLHFFRIQDYGSGRPRLRIRQDRDPTWTFLWLLKMLCCQIDIKSLNIARS